MNEREAIQKILLEKIAAANEQGEPYWIFQAEELYQNNEMNGLENDLQALSAGNVISKADALIAIHPDRWGNTPNVARQVEHAAHLLRSNQLHGEVYTIILENTYALLNTPREDLVRLGEDGEVNATLAALERQSRIERYGNDFYARRVA